MYIYNNNYDSDKLAFSVLMQLAAFALAKTALFCSSVILVYYNRLLVFHMIARHRMA